MTFDAVCLEQPVHPEAVKSSLLDRYNLYRMPRHLLHPRPRALQQTEQRATIASCCRVLRHSVASRRQGGDKPCCPTELQRRIERQIGMLNCGLPGGDVAGARGHRFLLDVRLTGV